MKVAVVIPAYNEEASVEKVVKKIPVDVVPVIIVVSNNFTDHTSQATQNSGAIVLNENIDNGIITELYDLNTEDNLKKCLLT